MTAFVVDARSVPRGVVRTSLARALVAPSAFFLAFVGGIASFTVWTVVSNGELSEAVGISVIAGALAGAEAMAWFSAWMGTNYGMELRNDGIVIYGRTLEPGHALRREVLWNGVSGVSMQSAVGSTVLLEMRMVSALDWPEIPGDQARAAFTDPHCPFFGRVPPEVARRIRLDPAAIDGKR